MQLAEIVERSTKLNALNGEVKAAFDLQLATTKKAQQDATHSSSTTSAALFDAVHLALDVL